MNQFELSSKQLSEKSVNLYIDEIKQAPDAKGIIWTYIGVLAVPYYAYKDILAQLLDMRDGYNGALHFIDLKNKQLSSPKIKTADRWLACAQNENSDIYFRILGIKMSNLCKEAFDEDKFGSSVYHRFLRSAILALLNGVFHNSDYHCVNIHEIYHDRTNRPPHWNSKSIDKIVNSDQHKRLKFHCSEIVFINSDHTAKDGHAEHSHFIQLIDLILGISRYILDSPAKANGAEFLTKGYFKFISELNDKNKSFKYRKKCGISYFPKDSLSYSELIDENNYERYKNNFFNSKQILWSNQEYEQPDLL